MESEKGFNNGEAVNEETTQSFGEAANGAALAESMNDAGKAEGGETKDGAGEAERPERIKDIEMARAMAEVGNWQRSVAADLLRRADKIAQSGGFLPDDDKEYHNEKGERYYNANMVPVLDEDGDVIYDEFYEQGYKYDGREEWHNHDRGDSTEEVNEYEHEGYLCPRNMRLRHAEKYEPDYLNMARALVENAKEWREAAEENENLERGKREKNSEEVKKLRAEIKELQAE